MRLETIKAGTTKQFIDDINHNFNCIHSYIIETGTKITEVTDKNQNKVADCVWKYEKKINGDCVLWGYVYIPTSKITFTTTQYASYTNAFEIKYPFLISDRSIIGNAGGLCSVTNVGSGGTNISSMDFRLITHQNPTALPEEINVNLCVFGNCNTVVTPLTSVT